MNGFSTQHDDRGDAATGLAPRLTVIAGDVAHAAAFADGEYIPQMSRESELRRAFSAAGGAAAQLEALKPRIAKLDGGTDGLRLAQYAIDCIEAGRRAIHDGVAVDLDLLGSGSALADVIATSTAGTMFRQAASGVRGIADIATIESVSVDDLFEAITRPAA